MKIFPRFLIAPVLAALAALAPTLSDAAATIVQTKSVAGGTFSASTGPHNTTFTAAVTAGNCEVVWIRASSGSDTITSVVGNVNGAFTRSIRSTNAAGTISGHLWSKNNISGGSETITVTTTGTGATLYWAIAEVTGQDTTNCIDAVSSTTDRFVSGTSATSAGLTSTVANDLVIGAVITDSAVSSIAPAGSETETDEVGASRLQLEWKAATTTGSYSLSWTLGSASAGQMDVALIKAATVVAPTLTGCSVTGTSTTGYTVGCTSNTTSTLYLDVLAKGTTTPANCAAVIAHSGALGFNSAGINSGSVSISITGLDFPKADLHLCSSNGAGSSSLSSLTNQFKSPPTGKQYITVGTLNNGSTTDASPYFNFSSPSIVSPDVIEGGTTVLPCGAPCPLTIDTSGNISFPADGSRQYDDERIYDDSAKGWVATDTAGTVFRIWFNNQPPAVPAANSVYFFVNPGVAITPIDLRTYCPDPEGDTVVVTVHPLDTLPTGVTVIASILAGTPSGSPGVYTVRFRCTDDPGDFADIP